MGKPIAPHAAHYAVLAALSLCGCGEASTGGDAAQSGAAAVDGEVDAEMPMVACDVVAPTACTNPSSSYADVEPIIQRRCVSCHDGTQSNWPLLEYSHVADWYDAIRGMMLSCSMPPPSSGMTMPTEEREAILLWIRCGFRR